MGSSSPLPKHGWRGEDQSATSESSLHLEGNIWNREEMVPSLVMFSYPLTSVTLRGTWRTAGPQWCPFHSQGWKRIGERVLRREQTQCHLIWKSPLLSFSQSRLSLLQSLLSLSLLRVSGTRLKWNVTLQEDSGWLTGSVIDNELARVSLFFYFPHQLSEISVLHGLFFQ